MLGQGQRIRLRRATTAPKNYTVRVPNTLSSEFMPYKQHSIKRQLNPILQEEIRAIQEQHGCSVPIDFGDAAVLITATSKTLHQRFSLLP